MKGKGRPLGWLGAVFAILALASSDARGALPEGPAGQYSRPVARRNGSIAILLRDSAGLIHLRTTDPAGSVSDQALPGLGRAFFGPSLAEDRLGRLWAVGEELTALQSGVVLARLTDGAPEIFRPAGQDGRFNRSPDLAFDAAGAPWTAWVSGKTGQEHLCVSKTSDGRTWTVAAGDGLVIARPRVLADERGRISVFWAGAWRGQRGVYYSAFTGSGWTEPRRAGGRADYPCLDAEPAADGSGHIWLVWSGYDGSAYGADFSVWDGRSWSATKRIAENPAGAARLPQLAFLDGGLPVAVWQEARISGRAALASVYEGGAWSRPALVAQGLRANEPLKIAAAGHRLAVAGGDAAAAVSFIEAAAIRAPVHEAAAPRPRQANHLANPIPAIIFNPLFSDSKYIGFGDSITYGVMDYEYAPEKGYIPRLQTLLTQAFGASAYLSNDGFPGELTGEGLTRLPSVMANRQARYLLLLEGTNDVKILEVPVDTIIFDLKEMLRKGLEAGVFPAIATLIPRRDWIWYFALYTDRFFAVNEAIPLMAAEKGVPLLDLFKIFDTYAGGADALISTDGVHPNEKGYQVMADEWLKAIKAYPFPPVQIQVRRETDKILFYRRSGNMLSWQVNPNIADAAGIRGVRVYRRKRGEGLSGFRLLSLVSGAASYFDAGLEAGTVYEYVLTAVRTDGIEGPASVVVQF